MRAKPPYAAPAARIAAAAGRAFVRAGSASNTAAHAAGSAMPRKKPVRGPESYTEGEKPITAYAAAPAASAQSTCHVRRVSPSARQSIAHTAAISPAAANSGTYDFHIPAVSTRIGPP